VNKIIRVYRDFGIGGVLSRVQLRLNEEIYSKISRAHRRLMKNKAGFYFNCHNFFKDIKLTCQVRQDIAANDLSSIDKLLINNFKKSDRVFVLASGSSVSDLTPADWEHISSSDSIGFNYWMVHDFVPDFYFIEPVGPGDVWEVLLQLFELRKASYSKIPFICDYKLWQSYENCNPLTKIPSEIFDNIYFYSPYYLRLNSKKLTLLALWYWRLFKITRAKLSDIIHQRASLSALIMFSIFAGYKEIVLVGVDLNDTAYFWETSTTKQYPIQPPNDQKGKIHRTADPEIDINLLSIPIDEYIYLLDRIILKPRGISLFIASEKSRLYPRLKKYTFPAQ